MLFVFELHQSHLFSPSSSDPASILPLAWSLSVISALQWVGSTNTPTWHCLPQANSLFLSQEWMNQSNEWINLGSRSGGGGWVFTNHHKKTRVSSLLFYKVPRNLYRYGIQRPAGGGAAGRPYTGMIADTHCCVIDTTVAHNSTYE